MFKGTGLRVSKSNRSKSKLEGLEPRQHFSATSSLAVGDHLYTVVDNTSESQGSDLYVANLDGSNSQLLNHWDFNHYAPKNLFADGDKLLFSACTNNITMSYEPWVSDGTVAGTKIIKDLYESGYGSDPSPFHLVNGRALFTASNNTPTNIQLYSTDGTRDGTVQLSPYGTTYGWGTAQNIVYGTTSATFTSYNTFDTAANVPFSTDGITAHITTTAVPANGLVTANVGSSAENSLAVHTLSGDLMIVNKGHVTAYDLSQVKDIALVGNQYDDYLSVDDNITLPVTFYSNGGADTFKGGSGVNTAVFNSSQANANADLGVTLTLTATGGSGRYSDGSTLTLEGVFQNIYTGTGNDTIIGTSRAESFFTGGGDDSIVGNGGPDSFEGGAGADTIVSGDHGDTIAADDADTVIFADPSTGNAGGDQSGGAGNNNSTGGTTDGNSGSLSSGGTTVVSQAPPFYSLRNGVLRITGSANIVNLIKLIGSAGSIKLNCNGQTAKVSLASVHTIIVRGGEKDDQILLQNLAIPSKLYGMGGDDAIMGSDGKDRIYGGDGDDKIYGGNNHDTIYGEAGNDRLFGDGGHDYLVGGAGANVIRGGAGVDHLIFATRDDIRANFGDKMTIDDLIA